jgi:hypothetical protein
MTPTCFGIIAILAASFLWLRKHPWRPYLELVLFFWGVTIGFGGLGIALWNHAVESGRPWGWAALVSHWPSGDTLEQVFWHGWPAAVATAVAGHWWWRASRWHGKHTVNNSTGGKGT